MNLKLAHVLGNSAFGGDTVYVYSLLEMAAEHGIEADLIAGDPEVLEQARLRGLSCVPFREIIRPIRPWRDLFAVRRLSRLLRQRGYDLVHTHTSKGGAVGRIAARRARVPVIVHTVQGYAFHEFSGALTTAVYARVERWLARYCDRIISVNAYDREMSLRRKIVRNSRKIVTVYNGVSLERLEEGEKPDRAAMLKEVGIADDAAVIVNLARLAPQKAQRYLLEAMPETIARASREVHLLLVGNGEDEAMLRRLTRSLKVDDRVHFLGFRRDGTRWFKVADVSVLSSLWEGHSVTILEAMALGTPVIATDIKGNRETIDHERTGLLVRPQDAGALAEAMIRYVNDPALARRHARAAREKCHNLYTEKHVQDHTWALYRTLLEEKGLGSQLSSAAQERERGREHDHA